MSSMPYVKFYSESFLTGVIDLTFEERGYYITLLCLQHQKGHLSEKSICLTFVIKIISEIADVIRKFERDDNGLFFNTRMDEEVQKAEKYVESRSRNGKNRWDKAQEENDTSVQNDAYAKHVDNTCVQNDIHMDTYRDIDSSSSILVSNNTELRESNEDSSVVKSTVIKTEKESKEEQKKSRKKKADSVSEEEKDEIKDFIPFVDEYEFSEDLRDAVINWLEYKNERKQYYTDRGIRTMLKQAKRKAKEFGEDAIISAFETAVERKWMGTLIGKMTAQSVQADSKAAGNVPKFQNKAGRFEQIDFDKIEV